MIHELQGTSRSEISQEVHPALPTPLSKIDPPYREHDLNYRKSHDRLTLTDLSNDEHPFSEHMDMSGLMYLCLIVISSMLVYGARNGKRSYLLPFFCLQLFDFAITT
jgi:lysosomal-associated transmembrane protein